MKRNTTLEHHVHQRVLQRETNSLEKSLKLISSVIFKMRRAMKLLVQRGHTQRHRTFRVRIHILPHNVLSRSRVDRCDRCLVRRRVYVSISFLKVHSCPLAQFRNTSITSKDLSSNLACHNKILFQRGAILLPTQVFFVSTRYLYVDIEFCFESDEGDENTYERGASG